MKDDKKKEKGKKKGQETIKEDEESQQSTIEFTPKLDKIEQFFQSGIDMVIDSNNKVYNLEDDLMPFIQKELPTIKEPEKNVTIKTTKEEDKKDERRDDRREKPRTPNFVLTEKFEWIQEARSQINEIF